MKTWDDWSDEDLSHAILIATHGEVINHFCLSDDETYVYDCGVIGDSFYRVDLIDINNPADMWPIILENNIVITPCMGLNIGDATCYSEHQNPVISEFNDNSKALRAAAIVFLMMNGVNPE